VTAWPTSAGFVDDVTAMVVEALSTIWSVVASLGAWVASPP
jgi:hypothetical protein